MHNTFFLEQRLSFILFPFSSVLYSFWIHKNVFFQLSSRFERSVFSSKEEDEDDDEDEEENWGSKENAEFFFSIFDQNNDGLIDEQELWSFFEAMSYNEMDIKQMVDNVFQMDLDHDSYLSVDGMCYFLLIVFIVCVGFFIG